MDNILINVNSIFKDKTLYSSNDFVLELPEQIKNIIYMKISSIEIPNIFYTFNDIRLNNYFKIVTGVNSDTINLGDSNFTSDTLIIYIQNKLDDINTTRGTDYTFSIDINTAKLSFTSSTSFTLDFSRDITNGYESLKYYLGFNNDTYTGTSIVAENILNLTGNSYIYININDINNIIDNKVSNAFVKILTTGDKYSFQFLGKDDYNSKDKVFRSPINLSKLRVKLLDYLGNKIDLLGDYSFTIEVGVIYDLKLYKEINNGGRPNGDIRLKFYY